MVNERDRITASRRDLITWMVASSAVAGCTRASPESAAPRASATVDAHIGPELPPPNVSHAHDPAADGEPVLTEKDWISCSPTTPDLQGPYFETGSPIRSVEVAQADEPGIRLFIEGRLLGPDCRAPLSGYAIDIWQADRSGHYYAGGTSSFRLRGKIVTDSLGRYKLETIMPGHYGDASGTRPAHLHAKIVTPQGSLLLTTQIYFAGDPYLGDADYCTRSGNCNSSDPKRVLNLSDATVTGKAGKRGTFDVYLPRT